MEHFTALKTFHMVTTAVLFLCALGMAGWVIRGRLAGDATLYRRTLQRPWSFAWLAMGLCLVALPVSGWWLAHYAGWPLGQTWLLGAALVYLVGVVAWLWLLARLNRLRAQGAGGGGRFTLALAIFCAVCFVAIGGLMSAKPI